MTSGTFHILPIGDITVRRDTRQRREISDIASLADSIRRLGLIHPVVVTRDHELVAGERRLAACRSLDWITVPVQYTDELEPHMLEAIELEENVKRQDIEWQDRVRAVAKYHKMRVLEDPKWSQTKTAEAIGFDQTMIAKLLYTAAEMDQGNSLVLNAPKLSTAIGITERARERREESLLMQIHSHLPSVAVEPQEPESVLTKDFNDWVLGDHKIRFNLIHCDFPYGIAADTFNQGAASAFGGYDDTPEVWERLMMSLEIATKTLTAPSCHLMFWFSMRKGHERLYEPTARALERIGWDLNPLPLIWLKSDDVGILPDPQRGPRQVYETCFLGSKGDRKIIRAVSNAYAAPTVRESHMSTKPEPMLRNFLRMLVDENTVLLDPTCGGGSALCAAESLGARYILGLEVNPEWAENARRALTRARKLRKASEEVQGAI